MRGRCAAFRAWIYIGRPFFADDIALANASVWDATTDFSTTSNGTGVWAYGTTGVSPGGTFSLFGSSFDDGKPSGWTGYGLPEIAKAGPSGWGCCSPAAIAAPDTLLGHPGPSGETAVLRFVAPTAGLDSVAAAF